MANSMSHPTHTFSAELNKVTLCLRVSPLYCEQRLFIVYLVPYLPHRCVFIGDFAF